MFMNSIFYEHIYILRDNNFDFKLHLPISIQMLPKPSVKFLKKWLSSSL